MFLNIIVNTLCDSRLTWYRTERIAEYEVFFSESSPHAQENGPLSHQLVYGSYWRRIPVMELPYIQGKDTPTAARRP